MLADDGVNILKIFLSHQQEGTEEALQAMEADPLESWRLKREDWEHHKKYDEYVSVHRTDV